MLNEHQAQEGKVREGTHCLCRLGGKFGQTAVGERVLGSERECGLGEVRGGAEEHGPPVFQHLFPTPFHPQISSPSVFYPPVEGCEGKD